MTEKEKTAAKERILKTAISLFAARGYDAVGVREIAEKANVNISMISYYFNGKIGILEAIYNDFHEHYESHIKNAIDPKQSAENNIKKIIYDLIDFIKEETEQTMVVYNTISLDIPEVRMLKLQKVNNLINIVSPLIKEMGLNPDDKRIFAVIGPGLFSFILTHFRLQSVKSELLNIEFDDAYFEDYKEIISTLFLKGVIGVSTLKKYKTNS